MPMLTQITHHIPGRIIRRRWRGAARGIRQYGRWSLGVCGFVSSHWHGPGTLFWLTDICPLFSIQVSKDRVQRCIGLLRQHLLELATRDIRQELIEHGSISVGQKRFLPLCGLCGRLFLAGCTLFWLSIYCTIGMINILCLPFIGTSKVMFQGITHTPGKLGRATGESTPFGEGLQAVIQVRRNTHCEACMGA
jgi:hypothetical protein